MGTDLQRSACLAFSIQRRVSRATCAGARANLLRIFLERFCRRQKSLDPRSGPQSLHRSLCETWADARSVDVFCLMAAARERFRATLADETHDAGAVDRRRQVVRQRTRRTSKARRG